MIVHPRVTAALITLAVVAPWLILDRGDGQRRPWFYRPRHRRPRWPWRRNTAFVGATADWSPAAEVGAIEVPEPPRMSLAAVLEEATDEHLIHERAEQAIRAEVAAELDAAWAAVEDAVIWDRMRTAATLARWQRTPTPTYDRSAAREQALTALFEEVTGPIDIRELRALVGAE
jgi:hypothetical protein